MNRLAGPPQSASDGADSLGGQTPPASSSDLTLVGKEDHVLGAADPELTLIEYGDFGCPHCFAASRPVKSLLDRYPGLRLIWRHLPDDEAHPGASRAAELSEMAGEQGKFWQAYDLLLTGRDHHSPEHLRTVIEELDLDPASTEAALRTHKYRERVLRDVSGANAAGIHGTPAFFLGGKRVEGSWGTLRKLVPAVFKREAWK